MTRIFVTNQKVFSLPCLFRFDNGRIVASFLRPEDVDFSSGYDRGGLHQSS